MISCKLQGGLGNQLFQIATTYALALRNNDVCGFDFNNCYTPLQGHSSLKYKDTILSKVNKVNNYNFRHFYNEPRFGYEELPYTKDLFLNGYFQSDKYFDDYRKEILDLFEFSDSKHLSVSNFLVNIGRTPFTSVHIRRGDYLKNTEFHPVCDVEYYKKAMELIGDSSFIFISDDMEWVEANFNGPNIYYSNYDDELFDLCLMTKCDNNVIANSSFSWWGAYLNQNEKKKVIVPKNWFALNGPKDIEDLIPKNWIIL